MIRPVFWYFPNKEWESRKVKFSHIEVGYLLSPDLNTPGRQLLVQSGKPHCRVVQWLRLPVRVPPWLTWSQHELFSFSDCMKALTIPMMLSCKSWRFSTSKTREWGLKKNDIRSSERIRVETCDSRKREMGFFPLNFLLHLTSMLCRSPFFMWIHKQWYCWEGFWMEYAYPINTVICELRPAIVI